MRTLPPFEVRLLLEDGSLGGRYQRDDSEMLEIWNVAVQETRALLEEW
jgi:creatinine amidohydrolase